jgi:uncharacterized RDD family membrane protein YckC
VSTSTPAADYAGRRLGLPAHGRGSVAGWGRRFLALLVDWLASLLVAGFLGGAGVMTAQDWRAWLPMLVYVVEAGVLTALAGGSFGQLVLRVAVVGADGRPVGLLRALLRTVLVCLVVPPLLSDRDRRGLHDLATKTVAVTR